MDNFFLFANWLLRDLIPYVTWANRPVPLRNFPTSQWSSPKFIHRKMLAFPFRWKGWWIWKWVFHRVSCKEYPFYFIYFNLKSVVASILNGGHFNQLMLTPIMFPSHLIRPSDSCDWHRGWRRCSVYRRRIPGASHRLLRLLVTRLSLPLTWLIKMTAFWENDFSVSKGFCLKHDYLNNVVSILIPRHSPWFTVTFIYEYSSIFFWNAGDGPGSSSPLSDASRSLEVCVRCQKIINHGMR